MDRFHVAVDGLAPSPDIDQGRTDGDNQLEKIFVTCSGILLRLPSPRSPDSRDGFRSCQQHSAAVAVVLPDAHSCGDDDELPAVAVAAAAAVEVDVDATAVAVVDGGDCTVVDANVDGHGDVVVLSCYSDG